MPDVHWSPVAKFGAPVSAAEKVSADSGPLAQGSGEGILRGDLGVVRMDYRRTWPEQGGRSGSTLKPDLTSFQGSLGVQICTIFLGSSGLSSPLEPLQHYLE